MSDPPRSATLTLGAGAIAFAPALTCLWFVARHAVNLPTGDEWEAMVPAVVSLADGDFPWQKVVQQDNEHRLAVPHLIQLALARVTAYDNRAELYLGWLCLLGTSVLLLRVLVRARGLTPRTLLSFAPANLVLFTLRQSENLIFAYQIDVLIAVFLAVATFALLERPSASRLGAAAVAAVASSFSHLLGLVVIPIAALMLLDGLRRETQAKRPWKRALWVWLTVAAVTYGLYFTDYRFPDYNPSRTHFLTHPWEGLAFLLAPLGTPWAVEPVTAIAVGALSLLGYGLALSSLQKQRAGLLAATMALSLGCAVMVAVGRSGFRDLAEAIPHRYTTYATPGLAALYLWALLHARQSERARAVLWAWLGVAVVCTPAATHAGLVYAGAQAQHRRNVAEKLRRHARLTDAELATVVPWNPTMIRLRAPALERVGWSVFRGAEKSGLPPLRDETILASVDVIDDVTAPQEPVPVRGDHVVVQGWAVDQPARALASRVRVGIDGVWHVATYGLSRDDVAASVGIPSYAASGYRAEFSRAALTPGVHPVMVEVVTADGTGRYLHVPGASVQVLP